MPGYQETSGQDVIINGVAGPVVTIDDVPSPTTPSWTIGSLEIGPGNVLDIVDGGALSVIFGSNTIGSPRPPMDSQGNLVAVDDYGVIEVADPTPYDAYDRRASDGGRTGGTIEALGSDATISFSDSSNLIPINNVDNFGTIAANGRAGAFRTRYYG